jgi:crotonobetainyl-CoA:carnitine CoA-transferase CaiB-like acyl-CoA transferase
MHFLSPAILDCAVNGRVTERAGNGDPQLAPHGVFPAAGQAVLCQTDDAWPSLCAVLGRKGLAADPAQPLAAGRLDRAGELDAAVAAWTAGLDAKSAACRLQEAGVAACPMNSSAECLADPRLAHRSHSCGQRTLGASR